MRTKGELWRCNCIAMTPVRCWPAAERHASGMPCRAVPGRRWHWPHQTIEGVTHNLALAEWAAGRWHWEGGIIPPKMRSLTVVLHESLSTVVRYNCRQNHTAATRCCVSTGPARCAAHRRPLAFQLSCSPPPPPSCKTPPLPLPPLPPPLSFIVKCAYRWPEASGEHSSLPPQKNGGFSGDCRFQMFFRHASTRGGDHCFITILRVGHECYGRGSAACYLERRICVWLGS